MPDDSLPDDSMTHGAMTVPVIALSELVSRPVPVPRLQLARGVGSKVRASLDIPAAVAGALGPALERVQVGESVAVGVGSRGIARLQETVLAVLEVLRAQGARPFIVPAMGSHGGATPGGQLAVLADLGITEESTGVPIRASMDTRVVGSTDELEVHVSEAACQADHVLVINRIKSHTSFSGQIESGLAKMVAIGLGKQRGAEELHRLGPLHLERRILASCAVVTSSLPVLGGLAVVESRHKDVDEIAFLAGDQIGGPAEAELLARARAQEARLPFDQIDVLIVDRMGKEISGTGMDTNVIGRRMVRGSPEPPGVEVTNIVVLEVSEGSEGNAVGIGLADFLPVSAMANVDLRATYANALTAGLQGVQRAQVPIVLATARDAVCAALLTAGLKDLSEARIVRIRSTLALDELMVSAPLLATSPGIGAVAGIPEAPLFDGEGAIRPWPTTTS
ncbi:conserved hypothetical protein [metagenome]|uniref:Uncharacterized protein n=1 Tax=metagenome TaxID=256318 RepID=A0A2P2C9X0_9ZZZZ